MGVNNTNSTRGKVKPGSGRISFCRNLTSVCVHLFPDGYFDFIYVDASHDYKSVSEDLRLWWPKLKKGREGS